MLFLLNTAVIATSETPHLPRRLASLARATPQAVLRAGGELFTRHPRLERDRPDIAVWYCSLLASKAPGANAALFVAGPSGYVGRLAEAPLPLLARLWTMQREGHSIETEARRTIWAPGERLARLLG